MAQFTNQAQLSYNGTVVNSNVAVGDLQAVLALTKTAVSDTYYSGGQVTYVVSMTNSGASAISGISMSDNMGAYTVGTTTVYPLSYVADSVKLYINGTLQTAPTVTAGPPTVFSGITLPANSNLQLIYQTDVTDYAPLDTTDDVVNTVTVTGTGISTPLSAGETVTPGNDPTLTITKNVEPVPVLENGILTYTFVIENTGNTAADATDAVSVTDTFNPILTGLTVTLNGDTFPTTSYQYNQSTGVFTTVPGAITVPAATYTQNPTTGAWSTNPGTTVLTVSGTV